MSKPKGKVPSLIGGSNGKPEIAIAGKKCDCKRCGDEIVKGDACSDIPNLRSPFSSAKRFCIDCYKLIIQKTKEDIIELERQIENAPNDKIILK